MIVKLDDLGVIFGILASAVAVFGGLFAALRYVIKAETSELRTNGGSTLKDAVNRIEREQVDAKTKLTETKKALDDHVADSRERVERGAKVEGELRQAIKNISEALPLIAASTPPDHQEHV